MYKYIILFKASLLDIRNEWSWYLLLMLASPLSILFFLLVIVGDNIGLSTFITGSVIMVLGTGVFLGLGQTLSMYKATGSLNYYLTFPLSRAAIMLSIMFRTVLLTLPSLIVLLIINSIISQDRVYLGFPFFVSLVLTSTSLAGLGTIIGITSKNMQVASILTQIITPIMIYLAPVFYEQDRLPAFFRWLSYILPTTYASISLRTALQTNMFSYATIVLAIVSIISIVYSTVALDWRS